MKQKRSKYYITRFVRFAPMKVLPSIPIPDEKSEKIMPIRDKWMIGYTYGLAYSDNDIEILIYPVREIDVYIWTERKPGKKLSKSYILDCNRKVQQKLISKGLLEYSLDTDHLFPLCNFIDIEKLSLFIPGSEIVQVPATRSFILGHDICYKGLGEPSSHILYVPCVFEDKVIVELFLRTSDYEAGKFDSLLNQEIAIGTKFQKIENNIWATPELIEELFSVIHL